MAVCLLLAVAANRKVGAVRKGGEKRKRMTCLWQRHFCPVLLGERRPMRGRSCVLSELHRLDARCKIGEPNVVPILRRKLGLRYTSWRTANGSDSHAFVWVTLASKPDNTHGHNSTSILLTSGAKISERPDFQAIRWNGLFGSVMIYNFHILAKATKLQRTHSLLTFTKFE
jgi:hypothetical protein